MNRIKFPVSHGILTTFPVAEECVNEDLWKPNVHPKTVPYDSELSTDPSKKGYENNGWTRSNSRCMTSKRIILLIMATRKNKNLFKKQGLCSCIMNIYISYF